MRGAFTATDADEWCDRRLLARMHRHTRDKQRADIQPVPPAQFMRFLFRWHQLASERRATSGAKARRAWPTRCASSKATPRRRRRGKTTCWPRACRTTSRRCSTSCAPPAAWCGGGRRDSERGAAQTGPIRGTPIVLRERDALAHWQQAAGATARRRSAAVEQGACGARRAARARRQLLRRPAARRRPARRADRTGAGRAGGAGPGHLRHLRRPARAGDAGRQAPQAAAPPPGPRPDRRRRPLVADAPLARARSTCRARWPSRTSSTSRACCCAATAWCFASCSSARTACRRGATCTTCTAGSKRAARCAAGASSAASRASSSRCPRPPRRCARSARDDGPRARVDLGGRSAQPGRHRDAGREDAAAGRQPRCCSKAACRSPCKPAARCATSPRSTNGAQWEAKNLLIRKQRPGSFVDDGRSWRSSSSGDRPVKTTDQHFAATGCRRGASTVRSSRCADTAHGGARLVPGSHAHGHLAYRRLRRRARGAAGDHRRAGAGDLVDPSAPQPDPGVRVRRADRDHAAVDRRPVARRRGGRQPRRDPRERPLLRRADRRDRRRGTACTSRPFCGRTACSGSVWPMRFAAARAPACRCA